MNTNPHPHKFKELSDEELAAKIGELSKTVALLQGKLHRMRMEHRRRMLKK